MKVTEKNLSSGGCNCLASVVQAGLRIEPKQIGTIACPVFLMWGREDRSHKLSQPESILELVPEAKIEVLEFCGHFPNLESAESLQKILIRVST